MSVAQKKSQLREDIRHRLQSFSHRECLAESRSLCRRLHDLLPREPQVIAAYYPLQDEADIRPLLTDLLREGHHVYLPRVERGEMMFRKMLGLSNLQLGSFNIPEPSIEAAALDPATLTHALIPGRAFDRAGNRLGRGNGGYDHWLRQMRSFFRKKQLERPPVFWGIALECQLLQAVPSEAHDEKVDAVVTARGLIEIEN